MMERLILVLNRNEQEDGLFLSLREVVSVADIAVVAE